MVGLRKTVKIPLIQCGLAELPGTMETPALCSIITTRPTWQLST